MFNSMFTVSINAKGNKVCKALKTSEMTEDAKSFKKTLEKLWDVTLDVSLHPDHTDNAAKRPQLWDEAFKAVGITDDLYKDILRGCMSISGAVTGDTFKLCSRAAFVKRFVKISDLMNEGVFAFANKQATSKGKKADNTVTIGKTPEDLARYLADTYGFSYEAQLKKLQNAAKAA